MSLPEDIFYLTDSDTSEEKLRIYIIAPPDNGDLLTVDVGDDKVLGREDFFTMSDVRRGKIRFSHLSNRSRKGEFITIHGYNGLCLSLVNGKHLGTLEWNLCLHTKFIVTMNFA